MRLWRSGRQLYAQTGSASQVALFFGRYTRKKLPLLASHLRTRLNPPPSIERRDDGPHVSIRVSGGIGDYIVMARFLRDFHAAVEGFVFDVYASTPEAAEWAFSTVPGLRACYPDILYDKRLDSYDAGFVLNQSLVVSEGRWGQLRRYQKLLRATARIVKARPSIEVFVERQPFMDNFMARKAVYSGFGRRNWLHHLAGIPYGGDAFPLTTAMSAIDGPYVTVHNGFDPGFVISGKRATKCYPHFDKVVGFLKERLPHLKVVQIGTSTSDPISLVDHNLINKTTLPEVAGIIRSARLHIDNEGGLVHIAACLGVKSCVVFGPTPADYFGYEGNINVSPPTCGGCWWINETWMDRCPRKFETALCMSLQDPRGVADRIVSELEGL
jgi:hypothetical protein